MLSENVILEKAFTSLITEEADFWSLISEKPFSDIIF